MSHDLADAPRTEDADATPSGVLAFTDIVGFTEFTANEGDERALELLDIQSEAVRAHLDREDRIVKELGDGLLVWFDDANRAIRKVLAIQARLRDTADARSVPLWVRAGLHWGCPTPRGDDLIGHDVNLASRVSDQAGAGEVLVTEPLLRAAGDLSGVRVAPLGPIEMKGIPDPVWLYRVS